MSELRRGLPPEAAILDVNLWWCAPPVVRCRKSPPVPAAVEALRARRRGPATFQWGIAQERSVTPPVVLSSALPAPLEAPGTPPQTTFESCQEVSACSSS